MFTFRNMQNSCHRAICKYYNQGYCKHEDEHCKFLHYIQTEMCKYDSSPGGCKYSNLHCKYIHSNDGYSSKSDNSASSRNKLSSGEKLLIDAEMKGLFEFELPATDLYIYQMKDVVYRNFPMMSSNDMASVIKRCDFNYIKTYACIMTGLQSLDLSIDDDGDITDFNKGKSQVDSIVVSIPTDDHDKSNNVVLINVMTNKYVFPPLEEEQIELRLRKEIDFIKNNFNSTKNTVYSMTCAICCCECPSSKMVLYTKGRQVCIECISNHSKQPVSDSIHSISHVAKVVSSDSMTKYDKRVIANVIKREANCIRKPNNAVTNKMNTFEKRQVDKAVSSDFKTNYDTRVIEENVIQTKADCITKPKDAVINKMNPFEKRQVDKAVSADSMTNYDKRFIKENVIQTKADCITKPKDAVINKMNPFEKRQVDKAVSSDSMTYYDKRRIEENIIQTRPDSIRKPMNTVRNKMNPFLEKMISSQNRKCPKCGAEIIKDSVFNHIICGCGIHFCYICKQKLEDGYLHFSRSLCPSQTSLKQDEEIALLTLQREANRERKKLLRE